MSIIFKLKVQFLIDNGILHGSVLNNILYDRRTKKYKEQVEILFKKIQELKYKKEEKIQEEKIQEEKVNHEEVKEELPPPLPTWVFVPKDETRAQKKRRLYRKNKMIKKQTRLEVHKTLVGKLTQTIGLTNNNFEECKRTIIFFNISLTSVIIDMNINQLKKLDLYVKYISNTQYRPSVVHVKGVKRIKFTIHDDVKTECIFYPNNTIESLKMFFDKSKNRNVDCNICFQEMKKSVGCTRCGERQCGECYINGFKTNKGIIKCPFCNFQFGHRMGDREIRFGELEIRTRLYG